MDDKHDTFYECLKEHTQNALGDLTGIPAATKVGVEKALAHALKHGTACEKAEAIILAAEWAHAHNELKDHK